MADKEIVNLPAVSSVGDDILIPCYVPGATDPAQKVSGAQLKKAFGGADGSTTSTTAISVTEGTDGSVTIVETLSDGSTNTAVITPDDSGNPVTLTYNGTEIPITWTEASA